MDFWLTLGVTAVISSLLLFYWFSRMPRPTCPNCMHKEAVVIQKDPIDVGFYDQILGDPGGGAKEIVTTFRITYRCRHCGHKWSEIEKDWNH